MCSCFPPASSLSGGYFPAVPRVLPRCTLLSPWCGPVCPDSCLVTLLLPFCPLVLLWVPCSFLDVSQPSPGWEAEGAGVWRVPGPARASRSQPVSTSESLFLCPCCFPPQVAAGGPGRRREARGGGQCYLSGGRGPRRSQSRGCRKPPTTTTRGSSGATPTARPTPTPTARPTSPTARPAWTASTPAPPAPSRARRPAVLRPTRAAS